MPNGTWRGDAGTWRAGWRRWGGRSGVLSDQSDHVPFGFPVYWTRFATGGNPNAAGAVKWPRYADKTDRRINLDATISVLQGFRRPQCEFWWGVYDAAFTH